MNQQVFMQAMSKLGLSQNEDGFWNTVFRAFDDMAIAEDMIEHVQKKYCKTTEQKLAVWNGFMACHSELVNAGHANGLYESHCKQILKRIADCGESADLSIPTDAELLMTFSQWSLHHAPGRDGASVMWYLFKTLFPRRTDLLDNINIGIKEGEEPFYPTEPWQGFNEETVQDLRRKLSRTEPFVNRKMKPRWLWGFPKNLVTHVEPPVAPTKWFYARELTADLYTSWHMWFDLEDSAGKRYTYLGKSNDNPDTTVWVWPAEGQGFALDSGTMLRFVRAADFDEKWAEHKETT